jgi:RHS repeat-associated protein
VGPRPDPLAQQGQRDRQRRRPRQRPQRLDLRRQLGPSETGRARQHRGRPEGPLPGEGGAPESAKHKYSYDAWNRLVKATNDSDVTIVEYRYDGLGRRIRKFTDKDGDNWTVREYYYNNQWQNLEVRKDAGKARAGSPPAEPDLATTLNEQYVWSARYVDAPVLRDRDTDGNGTLDETLYYTTDGNSNITALVGTDGAVVERYLYDSYGKATFLTGAWVKTQIGQETPGTLSAYANEVLYSGYRLDPETGLYHVRHRVYHVALGLWLERDPEGYVDGMSLYEYCRSRPAVETDALGLEVYVVFSYVNPDKDAPKSFKRAGETWRNEVQGSKAFDAAQDVFIDKTFKTEQEFKDAWHDLRQEVDKRNDSLRKDNKPEQGVKEARVFTHASPKKDTGGLELADGTLTRDEIKGLEKIRWDESAVLGLHGCRTGVSDDGAEPLAQTFADSQRVKTVGEMGKSTFSQKEDTHVTIDSDPKQPSSKVYLHSYDYGQNATLYIFGSNKRIPSKEFLPRPQAAPATERRRSQ